MTRPPPTSDEIAIQVDRILKSEKFARSDKLRSLLSYLVEQTLAGEAEKLKGYSVGVDVFDRGADFDPTIDAIVRVQVGRLRGLMEEYYAAEGAGDPILIVIPKGGYKVESQWRPQAEAPSPATQDGLAPPASPAAAVQTRWNQISSPLAAAAGLLLLTLLFMFMARHLWDHRTEPALEKQFEHGISIAVLPFSDLSPDWDQGYLADGLTDDVVTALSRIDSLKVVARSDTDRWSPGADRSGLIAQLGVDFVLDGGIQKDGDKLRVNVQLTDARSGGTIWAETYDRVIGDLFSVQDDIVTSVATEMRPALYTAAKRALNDRPTASSTAWELYMRATFIPGEAVDSLAWEKERVSLARRAVEIDPEFGEAHSVLADKLAYLANVDPPSDTPELREEARDHARLTLKYAPDSADAVFNLQSHHWHNGEVAQAVAANRRVLDLDPNHPFSRFLVKVTPYTCAAAPRETIEALAETDRAMSPDNPARWLTHHWLSYLYIGIGDYEAALDMDEQVAQIFTTPDTVTRHAALLVHFGREDEAIEMLRTYRKNWPNLDPRHYAEAAIARRCMDQPNAEAMTKLYTDLADAVERNSTD